MLIKLPCFILGFERYWCFARDVSTNGTINDLVFNMCDKCTQMWVWLGDCVHALHKITRPIKTSGVLVVANRRHRIMPADITTLIVPQGGVYVCVYTAQHTVYTGDGMCSSEHSSHVCRLYQYKRAHTTGKHFVDCVSRIFTHKHDTCAFMPTSNCALFTSCQACHWDDRFWYMYTPY